MAEVSFPWANGLVDGGPYSADYLKLLFKMITIGGQTSTSAGVLRGQLFELAVSSTGNNNIHVLSGRAIVDYYLYENNAAVDLTVASPSTGTTGGLVVLNKDYSTGKIRIATHMSADGTAAIPSPTQTAGVTWEIPLASFTITTGGVIGALTDARLYVANPDSRRERWFPVTAGTTMNAQGTHPGAQLAASSTSHAYIGVNIPFDFVTIVSAFLVTVTTAAGAIQREIDAQFGLVSQNYNANTATIGPGTRTMVANQFNEEGVSSLFTGVVAGDYVGIDYWRDGANAADVNTGTTQVLGVRLVYKAA